MIESYSIESLYVVNFRCKVLNAYEFERHASCKTKHPNNHIYFENGKTIYQIVQELRSTPESILFDTIQTVFGAPINQKSFRIWKGKNRYLSQNYIQFMSLPPSTFKKSFDLL